MKRRNKEINIFSMSALDLFASALGAFILIAVVLFPYFPNVDSSPERLAEIRKVLNQEKAKNAALEKENAMLAEKNATLTNQNSALENELKRIKFPHLDLVIALDVTHSMSDQIASLKEEIDQLSNVLTMLAPSVAIGIVAFGDRYWQQPLTILNLKNISSSSTASNQLKTFIARMESGMGLGGGSNPDNPEAFAAALNAATQMSWRSQSQKKIVVLVTDNPAYREEQSSAISAAATFAANGGGRAVSTVFINTGNIEPNTRAFLRQVAKSGQGQAVIGGGSMTANLLLSLL